MIDRAFWFCSARMDASRALAHTLELLVVQFFELLDEPWLGVGRVLVNVVLLGVCHSMLYREQHLQAGPVNPSP